MFLWPPNLMEEVDECDCRILDWAAICCGSAMLFGELFYRADFLSDCAFSAPLSRRCTIVAMPNIPMTHSLWASPAADARLR